MKEDMANRVEAVKSTKLKMIEEINKEIDGISETTEKIIEMIYKAAYNEAIEDAFKWAQDVSEYADEILKLKKE